MIATVTFNPALDYELRLAALRPGEINRAEGEALRFGGKGINVSVMLGRLGADTTALGFTAGFTGLALEEGLARAGVRTGFVRLPAGLTRINVKVRAEEETELNGRGPAIPPESLEALLDRLDGLSAGDFLVLAGSVPAGLPGGVYGRILDRLAGRGVEAVVDAEGALLRDALSRRPFLVKPNRRELEDLLGRALPTEGDLRDGAAALRRAGARNVLVSLGAGGARLPLRAGRPSQAGKALGAPRPPGAGGPGGSRGPGGALRRRAAAARGPLRRGTGAAGAARAGSGHGAGLLSSWFTAPSYSVRLRPVPPGRLPGPRGG